MPRTFQTPTRFLSSAITQMKRGRRDAEGRQRTQTPFEFALSGLTLKLARHFGFCYGVENAIEIAYKALEENLRGRVFLLGQMIHNSFVNDDLLRRGARFLRTTGGEQIISFDDLNVDDIVILPAFGVSRDVIDELRSRGIDPLKYNATCPFVEKVWRRAADIGKRGFSIIVHGKNYHEETRATFSYAEENAPTLIIRDKTDADFLAEVIRGERPPWEVTARFADNMSNNFDPEIHLFKIGVVNQTTMLAFETHEIGTILRKALKDRFGEDSITEHFADTRDTLCYATSENQEAVTGMLKSGGDLALVLGGFNSSNTSHLAKLCDKEVPAFHIENAANVISEDEIRHRLFSGEVIVSSDWFPAEKEKPVVLISAGASTPDCLVEEVMIRLAKLRNCEKELRDLLVQISSNGELPVQ
jgi:4-hydroxy-3-methylbut-2-en-1-yl diphosphate reductase